ncbi:FMN-binding negative transcriptional regulator [Aliiroseovarius sp. KMU-50]|uniref:FMN-binding negative transcriptional regulator n=1 Tax=Aliiroseovarius salicola TaxID=3009082 RepID=A0ABT4W3B9_9RHOB|nr:FMN-binding negative transcriptional regulator [Aliiroseovarius sp. KMU-50]MDA5095026.1 FMN-binding negative transcriptional regulator [Aliiroseovarius sp. KMU-50]
MHPNPSFRKVDDTISLEFARRRAFGVLGVNGSVGPIMVHVPFLISENRKYAEFHLVRSNAVSGVLTQPVPATLAVVGPDGYVSPDWYEAEDQVPTWNYVSVHLRGHVEALPDDDLRDLLSRQSIEYEGRLGEKAPWSPDKMDEGALARMLRMIRPARLIIERIESTWKLGQNKSDGVRLNAASHMTEGFGQELSSLGDLMRNPPG